MSCHSTHAGVAATRYAREISGLDEAQVANLFHRLKRTHRDGPPATPLTVDETVAQLQSVRMRVEYDLRLSDTTRTTVLARLDKAVAAAQSGAVLDAETGYAVNLIAVEADVSAVELDAILVAAAATQRCPADRMRAKFANWRRNPNVFEDVTSPDAAFDPASSRPGRGEFLPSDKATARALRKLGWENYLAQPLPVFMYGTLRTGQPNSHLIDEATVTGRNLGTVTGVGVYGANWGFPYAQDDPAGTAVTVGEVVDLDGSWAATQVRSSLDHLEGFDSNKPSGNHYDRVVRQVVVPGRQEPVRAWVYLMTPSSYRTLEPEDLIAGGDWVGARAQPAGRAGWARTGRNDRRGWDDPVEPDAGEPGAAQRAASAFWKDLDDEDEDIFAGYSETDIAARYRAGGY